MSLSKLFFGRLAGHIFSIIFRTLAITFALGSSAVLAQLQNPPLKSLDLLARIGCETGKSLTGDVDLDTGFVAMFGVSEKTYSFRVLNYGSHALMIPAEQCSDPRAIAQKTFFFILSHSFQNRQQVRESYYYLMNNRGQLLNAVHFHDGRSHRFAFASFTMPVRRADFEAEKAIWISKISALPAAQRSRFSTE